MLTFAACPASAGPLPWNYSVQFGNTTDYYTLGTEMEIRVDCNGVEQTSTVYYILKGELTSMGQAPFGTSDLFSFSQGSWSKENSPPATGIDNYFTMQYRFGDLGEGNVFAKQSAVAIVEMIHDEPATE